MRRMRNFTNATLISFPSSSFRTLMSTWKRQVVDRLPALSANDQNGQRGFARSQTNSLVTVLQSTLRIKTLARASEKCYFSLAERSE